MIKFTPRGTVVVVQLVPQKEVKTSAGIVLPEMGVLYGYAKVIAVGPGTGEVAGGHTETFDLKPGQLVFMQTKKPMPDPLQGGKPVARIAGVRYMYEGVEYHLYEQNSVLGIVAEPDEAGDIPTQEVSEGPVN